MQLVRQDHNPSQSHYVLCNYILSLSKDRRIGDVPVTYADTFALEQDFDFKPNTSLREGLRNFAQWYAKYYR